MLGEKRVIITVQSTITAIYEVCFPMPTYGYECLSCDNQFEIFQSIKDDALTTCETCGGKLRKRIYPVGISFKGSGFYVNDYAAKPRGGSESSAPPAASEAAAPASNGEAKSEAKAEAKTETKPEAKSEPVKTEPKMKAETKTPAPAAS